MSENFLMYLLTFAVGLIYAGLVAWYRWVTDGELPPFAVTGGCSLVLLAFVALRGWEEGIYLLIVMALLGGPQIAAWQVDWLVNRLVNRRGPGSRELR